MHCDSKWLAARAAWLCWSAALWIGVTGATAGAGRVPANENEVVALVRPRGGSQLELELESLGRQLRDSPGDVEASVRLVRNCLELDRLSPDPRWLGQAMTALEPWSTKTGAPTEIRLVQALLRQRSHDFEGALNDLDAVVAVAPRNAEAWLVKSTVHAVRGELDPARRAAAALVRIADPITSATAMATVASLSGSAERSCELMERLLPVAARAPVAQRVWMLTQLAETRERLGQVSAAERAFRDGLALAPRDPYLNGALADLLLRSGRAGEVPPLLESFPANDSLLLRVAEARRRLHQTGSSFAALAKRLGDAFAIQAARGERVHRREEARFQLCVLGDADLALKLARENWEIQREPADLLLLQEAAVAMRSEPDLRRVRDWVAATHLEDVRLQSVERLVAAKSTEVHP